MGQVYKQRPVAYSTVPSQSNNGIFFESPAGRSVEPVHPSRLPWPRGANCLGSLDTREPRRNTWNRRCQALVRVQGMFPVRCTRHKSPGTTLFCVRRRTAARERVRRHVHAQVAHNGRQPAMRNANHP
ncbi:hypothetical protein FOCG_14062 [Fusarium oxysporum f. sp. radicis-lycopersici 26381]|nr:hypothetical protein FOWG_10621 [Fusarium oxysporum f. sp. lycopersici MN25]EXL43712.1 hypothetical protein FOCG_14062 [Fusarium oxysporum f. sp. radicis-lycopersici 26381]